MDLQIALLKMYINLEQHVFSWHMYFPDTYTFLAMTTFSIHDFVPLLEEFSFLGDNLQLNWNFCHEWFLLLLKKMHL